MVGDLTGLPTANASLLDEGTAAAEAMTLVRRGEHARPPARSSSTPTRCRRPSRWSRTRAEALGIEVRRRRPAPTACPTATLCGVLVQYPGASGRGAATRAPVIEAAHERGALAVVAADLLALTLLESPGRAGRRRRGRLHPALRRAAVLRRPARRLHGGRAGPRAAPARAGWSGSRVDADGPPGVPARAADPRAAHPPRQGDLATSAPRRCCWPWWPSMYAVYHGPDGLRAIAAARPPARRRAGRRAARGRRRGRARRRSSTPCRSGCPGRAAEVVAAAARARACTCAWSTPTTSAISHSTRPPTRDARSPRCCAAFGVAAGDAATVDAPHGDAARRRCAATTAFLTHPVFNTPPLRDRDAALPAPALRPRLRARPRHDPARLVHDEAQRDHRDGADQPARASPTCTRSRRPRTPPATAS